MLRSLLEINGQTYARDNGTHVYDLFVEGFVYVLCLKGWDDDVWYVFAQEERGMCEEWMKCLIVV